MANNRKIKIKKPKQDQIVELDEQGKNLTYLIKINFVHKHRIRCNWTEQRGGKRTQMLFFCFFPRL